ncbi:MAG: restriction endonuclease subunit S [Bacteroidales bacterium]|nr:restriction endonuclease subunit S [Bacteroidales bacterium]
MSKLKKLIDEFCPNGVKSMKLGEVCDFVNGFAFKSSLFREDGEKIIRITNINGRTVDIDDVKYFYKEDYKTDLEQFSIQYGDILIAMSGATTGKIGYYNYNDISYLNQRVGKFKPHNGILSSRYLYHVLLANSGTLYVLAGGGAQPNLSSTKLMETFEIPVPPIVVQEEIAKILDRFAEYAAELQAELQARQEQYEYYRNKLLTFNEIGGGIQGVIWMKMSEIGTFIRGNGLQKKDFTESGIPCIHYGQIYTHYGTFATKTKSYVSSETAKKCKKAHYGDLVFATVSENIDDVCKSVAWLGNEEICISGDSLAFSHNQNPKYIAYYFQTYAFARYKRSRVTGTKVIRLHQSQLEQFEIPIPSLAEQARIVNILDKFERLVNDLVQGLPAEIAAVQEQYEYYRDKLLSFPEYKLSA